MSAVSTRNERKEKREKMRGWANYTQKKNREERGKQTGPVMRREEKSDQGKREEKRMIPPSAGRQSSFGHAASGAELWL